MVNLYLAGVFCQVSIRPSFKTTALWLVRSRVHHVPAQSAFLRKTASTKAQKYNLIFSFSNFTNNPSQN